MTRVAIVQVASPDIESRDARISRVESLLRGRANEGIEFFVLPELWSAGYFAFDRYDELAEPLDGPTVTMCRGVAADLRTWVHVGSFVERARDGALHNTTVLVDPSGRIAQTYRKIHVFGYESLEATLLTPGTELRVAESPLGPLGSTTCYDLRFPGLWQELGDRGAEVAVVPAAWPAARREHWRVLTQARAIEHQLWVLAVNACGTQGGVELGGCSRVIDPWGRVLVECSPSEEEIAVVDVDRRLAARVRDEFPVRADRLPAGGYRALSGGDRRGSAEERDDA